MDVLDLENVSLLDVIILIARMVINALKVQEDKEVANRHVN